MYVKYSSARAPPSTTTHESLNHYIWILKSIYTNYSAQARERLVALCQHQREFVVQLPVFRLYKFWKVSPLPNLLYKMTIKYFWKLLFRISTCVFPLHLPAAPATTFSLVHIYINSGKSANYQFLLYKMTIELNFQNFYLCLPAPQLRAQGALTSRTNTIICMYDYIYIYIYN